MNAAIRCFALLALLALSGMSAQADAPSGKLSLPDFGTLSEKATNSVAITLDASLLGIAARFLDTGDPEEAAVKDIIAGLQGIYVRSYTFDRDFSFPRSELEAVRRQLAAPGWQKIVEVRNSSPQTSVDIYLYQVQQRTGGLAIISTEPREFTIVNIVGAIDLEKLHKLDGRFGMPKLPPGAADSPEKGKSN